MSASLDLQTRFDQLPRYTQRSFLKGDTNLEDKEEVISYLKELLVRKVGSPNELEKWVLNRSELDACLDQTGSILNIKMTCQTDNKSFSDAYQKFITEVIPAVKPYDQKLNIKYLELRKKYPLSNRYAVYDRAIEMDEKLYREKNIPLETEVDLLCQKYQSIFGAMTVTYKGKEHTLQQMGKYLEDTQRTVREEVWKLMAQRRMKEADKLDELFEQMMGLRNQIAKNAGFVNFTDFQFKEYHRFDYTPGDCQIYHKTVEECINPIWEKIIEKRKSMMKLKKLRPWDLSVDPLGREPLKPFTKIDDLINGVRKIFENVDPHLGEQFAEMSDMQLLELESRKGKAPGGYQSTLSEARKPFIFMNAVGVDYDVRTLLHEGGHAFHSLAASDEPLYDYRHAPMEFCEVASMSMELLGGEHLSYFYSDEDWQRSKLMHFEGIIHVLIWVANIDAFQHWIYAHPGHTKEERSRRWVELFDRFGGNLVDWNGLQSIKEKLWHRQLHIFEVPFYYIEYGIAQLGALQVFSNARKDKAQALKKFQQGLRLGGSKPLPELFKEAGIKFDFSRETIVPLIEVIAKELSL